jgi:DNA-binding IclR family transcriptional regulator
VDSVTSGVQVLDRAVLVLDTVARDGPCALADLVAATGLPRPTAHRLAVALVRLGLLGRDGDGRFAVGGRLAGWGAAANRRLADAARPVLAELADATGESAQLYVREGDQRVCVSVHERPSGLRDTVPLGAVLPLDRGSGGKVLLAWASDADRFGVDAATRAAVRRRGWAESAGEREAGVASVSAPVYAADGLGPALGGNVVGAISVSGPIERLGVHPGKRLSRAVLDAAGRLSVVIGA